MGSWMAVMDTAEWDEEEEDVMVAEDELLAPRLSKSSTSSSLSFRFLDRVITPLFEEELELEEATERMAPLYSKGAADALKGLDDSSGGTAVIETGEW